MASLAGLVDEVNHLRIEEKICTHIVCHRIVIVLAENSETGTKSISLIFILSCANNCQCEMKMECYVVFQNFVCCHCYCYTYLKELESRNDIRVGWVGESDEDDNVDDDADDEMMTMTMRINHLYT